MNEPPEKILEKKIGLIYEYNKKSPVFIRIANNELEKKNIQGALEVLEEGLRYYPNHPAALILIGKAFAMKRKYSKALEYFRKAADLLQWNETFEYYAKEVEKLKKQHAIFESSPASFFSGSSESDTLSGSSVVDDSSGDATESIDERLDLLAEEISKAKISMLSEDEPQQEDFIDAAAMSENMIVSETLAKIYIAQEEYDEAIRVYEKLIKKDPAKYEYYTERIKEIRSKKNN